MSIKHQLARTSGKSVCGQVERSRILSVLGPDMFAEFKALRVPGRVVWCNFELARELGFDVPASHQMTREFHLQLVEALSYRALTGEEEDDLAGRATINMYADKYGGDGVLPALGSGRAGFLPYGNLSIKGIGHTPLFKHDDPDDFEHSHGGLNMFAAIAEALFGEVNVNLFSKPSTRILAIIDQGDNTIYPDGRKVARAIVARAGHQLRPGHVLAERSSGQRSRFDLFISITGETGQLVQRTDAGTGALVPHLRATMLRVIDDHARIAAEQVRWRITHMALSTSNMQMDGGMLDVTAQRANPRTTPIRPPSSHPADLEKIANRDYMDRVSQMKLLYSALRASIAPDHRRLFRAHPIVVKREMGRAYLSHLELQLLCAAGLKMRLAERLRAERYTVVKCFMRVLMRMTELKNRTDLQQCRLLIEEAAVVDVFQLLQHYPEQYFKAPTAGHLRYIARALNPIYRGDKILVAGKRAAVKTLIRQFSAAYHQLMTACLSFAEEYYDDVAAMRRSIEGRAAFENRPLKSIYRTEYFEENQAAPITYRETLEADIFRDLIDRKISASVRNVDALLVRGGAAGLPCGGLELQKRTIDGITYSVRAWDDERQTRYLHVRVVLRREGGGYVASLPGAPVLTERQVASLRYKFTTDEWKNSGEASARLERSGNGCALLDFAPISFCSPFGELEGTFYVGPGQDFWLRDGAHHFRGYTFAIPDRQELLELSARLLARAPRVDGAARSLTAASGEGDS
ncbi:MAG TPA: hypothetical protein VGO91_02810 [Pyrinomonadaceae bacterium]|nr:hypothetical protein [Pyrinomonadaceae bacterium]